MPHALQVTTRDTATGRYHKRYQMGNRVTVDERCVLTTDYEILDRLQRLDEEGAPLRHGVPASTPEDMLCEFCFRPSVAPPLPPV